MDDELKKVLLLWVSLPAVGMATQALAPPAFLPIWHAISPFPFGFVVLATVAAPFVQRARKERALRDVTALIDGRRYVDALTHAERARRLWPRWKGMAMLRGLAETVLWRVEAARLSFLTPLSLGLDPDDEREVMRLALVAAELAGNPDRERARVARARLPAKTLEFPNFIRAARERDWQLVLELGKTLQVEACFAPLVDVLLAMAEEDTNPRPIDKITFLGETGLEQVEKFWPDLADFVKRAPSV
jgi:hypothetical protein